ncbi:AAA family ATPase [Nocardioides bruguierae]|uniref:AAA family ATPase n=1 Tax=Nocardioides bruguierae TaxID=2945102 RepID=A0A9X2DBI0_9ACTN|nr:AAA family ATPase [Nocardioides bruguierae]MCM0622337.1 AAA family ATPase [Nocardioides bruguierae]
MGGVDTYRGIAYQHAQAVLSALDVLESDELSSIRVEGNDDVIDIELLDVSGRVAVGKQAKVRADEYTWAKAELVGLLRRWAAVDAPEGASFQFVTDGRLGPSGVQVRDALAEAAAGRRASLAELLGEDADGATVRKIACATLVQDPGGTGALLARADRQVMALLPSVRSRVDAMERARSAVDALLRLLLDRACRPDAAHRVVSRDEICCALGIPPSSTAVRSWADMRDPYLAAIAADAHFAAVPARLHPQADQPAVGVDALLVDGATPGAVAGPTGAGKSTAARELRTAAAAQGRVVIVAHAETYIPGRVDALVADTVSDVLGREIPTLTGRQILADNGTVIVIDGVSEVPEPVRTALAEDLRASVASGRGARLILLGRGLAAVRSVLPASFAPSLFRMEPFGRVRRQALAECTVDTSAGEGAARVALARAERALGDAAGNPMLLEMTIGLIASGVPFEDRAAVYNAFLDRLAIKTGADGLGVATVVLGACFARLLDEGRRYSDPYTWRRLLVEAARDQSAVIGPIEASAVDETARRSGLLVRLGQSETVAAVHDSFADYLAGLALARGAVAFPTDVKACDEERLLFAAQIGGLDLVFAETVASRLPFALPRFAPLDRRALGDGSAEELSVVLRAVLPPGAPTCADLWRHPDGRVVAFSRFDAGVWLTDDAAHAAMATRPWVAGAGGPIDLAVRLWRQWLVGALRGMGATGRPRPTSAEEARDAVASHAADVAAEVDRLVRATMPAGHRAAVAAEIGPTGLTGQILPAHDNLRRRGADWTVAYTQTKGIDVSVSDGHTGGDAHLSRRTLDSLIGASASSEAAKRVSEAIDRLAGGRWL